MEVSVLSKRHCAFVRYNSPEEAAVAMKKLQVIESNSSKCV